MLGTDQHLDENGQGSSLASQLPHTQINSPAKFIFESGRHDISLTRMSLVFNNNPF